MSYLIDSVNNFKNKDIENIISSNTIDELLKIQNPYDLNLRILLDSTISNISDNLKFYNGELKNIDLEELKSTLKLNENELKGLKDTNDIKVFLENFKKIVYNKSFDTNVKTYDLIGIYVKTINNLTNKKFINKDYMDQMVESINKLEPRLNKIDVKSFALEKVLFYRDIIEEDCKDPSRDKSIFRYYNIEKIKLPYDEIMSKADEIDIDEASKIFYNSVKKIEFNDKINHDEIFINEGFVINESSAYVDIAKYSKLNQVKKLIKDNLLSESELKDESNLQLIKEALQVIYLKNDDLIKFLSKDNMLFKIKDNKILNKMKTKKDFEKIGLDKKEIEKILTLREVTSLNDLVRELSGSELNVNATKLFYEKFGVDMAKASSQKYVNSLFKKFQELKESSGIDKNNILILIALSSFDKDTKKYDKKLEEKYIELLKKPLSNYDENDLDTLHTIKDKWLQWSICYNREIQDNSICATSIKPENFDFSSFQKMKKLLNLKETTPEENEIIQTTSILKSLEIKNIGISELVPKNEFETKIVKEFINLKPNIDVSGYLIKTRDEFYVTMNIYSKINDNQKILDNIADNKIPLSGLFKSNKDSIRTVLANLNNYTDQEIKAIVVMLESSKAIPNVLNNMDEYLKFYSIKMDLDSYKNYNPKDSLVPVFDSRINNKYEVRALTVLDFASIINGEVGNHCMSYGGSSWRMLDYMFENPNKMYITQLEREHTAIANAATWVKENTICFDSIEVIAATKPNEADNMYQKIIENSFREQSMKLLLNSMDKGIERITMGKSDYNNKFRFDKISKSVNNSTHPLVCISVNEIGYSDAKSEQSLIFSFNTKDLLSKDLSNMMIQSLKEYHEFQDSKPELLKEFVTKFKAKINEVLIYNETLRNSIHYDVLEKIEKDLEQRSIKNLD